MARTYGSQVESTDTASGDPKGFADIGAGVSGTVVAANPRRALLILTNDSDTVLYLSLGAVAAEVNKGIRLNASGGAITIREYTGEVRAFNSGVAAKRITYAEV